LLITAAFLTAVPAGAATDKQLVAVRGTSGYQTTATSEFRRVESRQLLGDDNFAVTQAASNALVVLPDSSEVALGAATSVRVGAFNQPTAVTPTTITLNNGAVRFNVKHPTGGRANYLFQTNTSQIAVRGTVALYKSDPVNGDVISCLVCAPGDVVVTVNGKTFELLSGTTLFISTAHIITTSTSPSAPQQAFQNTGLTTSATSVVAFTAEVMAASKAAAAVGSGAAAGAGADTALGAAVLGGAAVGGIIIGTKSNNPHPTTTTGPDVSGSAQLTGTARGASPTPAPTHAPH
jgi:hypothetical protein